MQTDSTAENMEQRRSDAIVTVPNALCAARLFGAPALLLIAWYDAATVFVAWFFVLAMTDWLDGKLAIILDQRSVLGTRLDSAADVTLYGSLLGGAVILRGAALLDESPWIAAVVISYLLAGLASVVRFGCWPSYHTRMAKSSWLFTMLGAFFFLLGWSPWPLRFAMAWVTLGNIESLWITFTLPRPDINVSSILAARRFVSQGKDADDAAADRDEEGNVASEN